MQQLKQLLSRSLVAQLVAFLICYWVVHALCMTVFFQGFLGTFDKWCFAKDGSTLAGILTDDPFHHSWSILLSSLLNPFFLLALLVLYVPYFLQRKSLPAFTKAERIFFGICALLLACELITYDYNYYLNSAFWFDRILLLLLSFALIRYPVLIPLFTAFAFVYRAQFNFPVDGFPLYDKRLLFDLLILAMTFTYIRMAVRDFRLSVFHIVLCIIAANYFFSGLDKITSTPHGYEWLTENDSADLYNNVVIRGWLACSSPTLIDSLRWIIMEFGPWMQAIVFLLEVGVVLVFWKRRLAIFWLSALFLMHIGIFVFGSMLFWKWMAIDLALIILLIRRKKYFGDIFERKGRFALSLFIVFLSLWWLKPTSIAWHDTPYIQYFTYQVQDEQGNWHAIDKNEMNPYHQWFQYDHFGFLVCDSLLDVSGFGYTSDYELAERLREPAFDYTELVKEKGVVKFDSARKLIYEKFIRTYFGNRNERIGKELFVTAISPPHHLHTYGCGDAYTGNFRVQAFRVLFNREVSVGSHHMPIIRNTLGRYSDIVDEIRIYE